MQIQSLVPVSRTNAQVVGGVTPSNGAGRKAAPKATVETLPSLDELLATAALQGRGWRGWLRVAQVGRVLGLLTLYLFLDSYDVRAKFNQRAIDRWRERSEERRVGKECRSGWLPEH